MPRGERVGHDSVAMDVPAGPAGNGRGSTPGPAVRTSYPSTPPKVVDGRKARRGSGCPRRAPTIPNGPSTGVHAVRSSARSRTQERCLCRLPGRTVMCRLRLGGPPSSEGRGDRGGKRCRLRSAEAAQPAGPGQPGVSAKGSRARRIAGGGPVTEGHARHAGGREPGWRSGGIIGCPQQARPVAAERFRCCGRAGHRCRRPGGGPRARR
jgi:hypothetical protein